jgi:hypothetical protein
MLERHGTTQSGIGIALFAVHQLVCFHTTFHHFEKHLFYANSLAGFYFFKTDFYPFTLARSTRLHTF